MVPLEQAQENPTFGRMFLTCFIVPATHYEIDHLIPVQGVLVSHDTEGGQTPIDGVHPKVCGEVVH